VRLKDMRVTSILSALVLVGGLGVLDLPPSVGGLGERVLAAATMVAAAQAPADLSGTWRYNAEASDVGGAGGDDPGGPGGGRLPMGGGFGMPGRAPMGGFGGPVGGPAGRNPELMKQRMELMRELMEPVRRMTIAQDGTAVSFTFDDGRTVRYRTHGKTEKHQHINGVVETETRWKKDKLVRETHLDDGLTIEETFSVGSPRALVVEVKLHGGAGRRKPLRRVYDPVE
jgi:hypothetical protein